MFNSKTDLENFLARMKKMGAEVKVNVHINVFHEDDDDDDDFYEDDVPPDNLEAYEEFLGGDLP